jgi:hypothetical protein
MTQYKAYYRVSTDKHGIKGLGTDAQREAASRLMAGKGDLAAQFIEVESGAQGEPAPSPRRTHRMQEAPRRAGHRQA